MTTKTKKQKVLFLTGGVIIFIVMFSLNWMTPFKFDDYGYYVKTKSIWTIFSDEYHQYMTWTGRSVVHVILRLFAKLPKIFFNIFNSVIFLALVYQILRLTKIKQTDRIYSYGIFKLLFIFSSLWLFVPVYRDVFLWMSGSINYSTAMVIMLGFILYYHNYVTNENIDNDHWSKIIWMFLLGILAGWCNENTSGGTIFIILGYSIISVVLQKKKIQKWMLSGFVGSVIGYLILVLAPGNAIRSEYFSRNQLSFFGKILDGLTPIAYSLRENAAPLIILTFLVLIFSFMVTKLNLVNLISALFLVGGLLTIWALIISPAAISWSRSYFGGIIFILISLYVSVFNLFTAKDSSSKLLISGVFAYVLPLFICSFFIGIADIYRNYSAFTIQQGEIAKQLEAGEKDIVVEPLRYLSKTNFTVSNAEDFSTNKDSSRNKAVAAYLGVNSIRSEEKSAE